MDQYLPENMMTRTSHVVVLTYVVDQPRNLRLHTADHLDARVAISQDRNSLALPVILVIPACAVNELALEVPKTLDIRPLPFAVSC